MNFIYKIPNFRIPIINKETHDLISDFDEKVHDPMSQRRLVLVIVCVALLLDNMLYMVIVPIIPVYLQEHAKWSTDVISTTTTTTMISTTTTTLPLTSTTMMGNRNNNGGGGGDGGGVVVLFNLTTAIDSSSSSTTVPKIKPIVLHPPDSHSGAIGLLFASKAIIQLMVNPVSGAVMDRVGYDRPLLAGLLVMCLSTTIFSIGTSYAVLFMARSMQGIGSAFADTAGLAMIADIYTTESERTKALGISQAFISFGSLFAPPFGGILYELAGKQLPFLILAFVALVDGLLLFLIMKPNRKERQQQTNLENTSGKLKPTPIYKLILDPYIAVCAGALVMANVSLAFIEPTIALWMSKEMAADEWQIGMVWLPAFFPHVFGVYLTVRLARNYPHKQWQLTLAGLAMEGISCLILPFCTNFFAVIVPLCVCCFGIALIDTSVLPMLGFLVDNRHVSVYGSIYAIADISYSLAYAFGPIVAGNIVETIGFTWLNVGIFVSNFVYLPVILMLRNVYDYKQFANEGSVLITGGGGGMPGDGGEFVGGGDGEVQIDYKTYIVNDQESSIPCNGSAGPINHLQLSKDQNQQQQQQQQQQPLIPPQQQQQQQHQVSQKPIVQAQKPQQPPSIQQQKPPVQHQNNPPLPRQQPKLTNQQQPQQQQQQQNKPPPIQRQQSKPLSDKTKQPYRPPPPTAKLLDFDDSGESDLR